MAVVLHASGTQSATVTTEHFLSSPNMVGKFCLQVDLSNMVAGDVLELRCYKMVLGAGTQRVAWVEQFSGVQPADALIIVTDEIANTLTDTNAVRFSLKQTFGTSRNFAWAVYNTEDLPLLKPTIAGKTVNKILTSKLLPDVTYYALIWNDSGQIFNGSTFETFVDANYSTYAVTMTELGTSSGRYAASLPGALSATTRYTYEVVLKAGGSVAITDDVHSQGIIDVSVNSIFGDFETGTAQAGAASTITLRSGASSVTDYFKDQVIFIKSGTGALQTNRINAYNGTTKVATVSTAWATQPDATSVYIVLGRVG